MKCWIGVASLVLLPFLTAGCRRYSSADNAGDRRRHTEALEEQGIENGKKAVRPEDGRRHTEAAGGFSFVPPENWEVCDFPGRKFKVAVGPASAGFAPNINIVDESFNGSLDDYIKASLKLLPRVFKKYSFVKQDNFVTEAGIQGIRVIVKNEQHDRLLRQTFYSFSKKNTKFTVTCTALAEGGDELDSVFEASVKTFRFDAQ